MRLMGLDIGDKTIGVALSDPLFISAHGLETYMRVGIKADANYILKLCQENEVKTIVCGLPLMLAGTDSPQTEKVRAFATVLQNKIRGQKLGIAVEFQDERFTTKIAEAVLMETGMKRKERKEYVDKQAAVLILQSYMDRIKFQKAQEEREKEEFTE